MEDRLNYGQNTSDGNFDVLGEPFDSTPQPVPSVAPAPAPELIPAEVTTPEVSVTVHPKDYINDPEDVDAYVREIDMYREAKTKSVIDGAKWEQETLRAGEEKRRKPQEGDWTSWSSWMKGAGEATTQAVAGVDDLGRNVLGFMDPLTEWLNDNVADLRYDPFQGAKTQQGEVVRVVSRYATAMIPATKVIKGIGVGAKVGQMGTNVIAGAAADVIAKLPDEARVADMLLEMGVEENLVLQWLKTDKNDGVIEDKIKTAVEGLGVGFATDLVVRALPLYRAARNFMRKNKDDPVINDKLAERERILEAETKSYEQSFKLIAVEGAELTYNPTKAAATVKGKRSAATKALNEAGFDVTKIKPIDLEEGGSLYVNWGMVGTSDDVKQIMANVTEATTGLIDKAKRGKRGDDLIRADAERMGMTVEEVMNRPKGAVWNDAQVLAARMVWENAADNFAAAAERALKSGTKADLFIMRKMQATFAAVNAEIRGASAESARSLRAWGVVGGDLRTKMRLATEMLDQYGGQEMNMQLAARFVALQKQGLLKNRAGKAFVEQSLWSSGLDAVREAWVASLLWMPSTHIVNGTSGLMVMLGNTVTKAVAGMTSKGMDSSEGLYYAIGTMTSLKDAFRYGGKALFTDGQTGQWMGKTGSKVDAGGGPRPMITPEAFGVQSDTVAGKTVSAIGHAFRVPFKVLGAGDEFMKTMIYRGELMALISREARSQNIPKDQLQSFFEKMAANPPKQLQVQAADMALWSTFQDKGGVISRQMSQWRNNPEINVAGRFLLTMVFPFVKTPSRILNYIGEHSPFAMTQKKFWAELNSGDPARASIAKAKLATGTASMAIFSDMADNGIITGAPPRNPAEREAWVAAGNQPYSIKVGDKWYSYNRMDPIGAMMGVSADLATLAHRYELSDADMNEMSEIASGAVLALANVVINKNYMQGLAKTLNAISDPDRYGKWWAIGMGSTFLPAHSFAQNYTRTWVDDGTYRQINDLHDAYQAKLGKMAQRLTPVRDIWGRPMQARSGYGKLYDFLTPVTTKPVKEEPIGTELVRLARSPYLAPGQAVPSRIEKNTTFKGVPIDFSENPKVYDEYVRLAGNDLKLMVDVSLGDLGCMDFLNLLVEGKVPGMSESYKAASDSQRLNMIRGVVDMYRNAAAGHILQEHPDFNQWWMEVKENTSKLIQGSEDAVLPQ